MFFSVHQILLNDFRRVGTSHFECEIPAPGAIGQPVITLARAASHSIAELTAHSDGEKILVTVRTADQADSLGAVLLNIGMEGLEGFTK